MREDYRTNVRKSSPSIRRPINRKSRRLVRTPAQNYCYYFLAFFLTAFLTAFLAAFFTAFFLAAIPFHLLLVIRVVRESHGLRGGRTSKKRAEAPQNLGSTNYLRKEEVITSSSSRPSSRLASLQPSSLRPCYLPPSLRDTDLGDNNSETMAVVSKWVTHSHRSVASVAATTSGIAIQLALIPHLPRSSQEESRGST